MFEELGISFGTALIILIALYFIVKWAVKNGIKEAYKDITGKDTMEDIEAEKKAIVPNTEAFIELVQQKVSEGNRHIGKTVEFYILF